MLDKFPKQEISAEDKNFEPMLCGDNYYSEASEKPPPVLTTNASCSVRDALKNVDSATAGRGKLGSRVSDKYKNIAQGILPYNVGANGIDIRETIELCQKAYANIDFRNAVDVMSEFSNSDIYLEGSENAEALFTGGSKNKFMES